MINTLNRLCWISLVALFMTTAGCISNPAPPAIMIGHVSDKTRADNAGDQAEFGIRMALHDLSKGDALVEAFQGRAVQVRHTDTRGEIDAFESQAVRLDSVNRCVALIGALSAKEVGALDHVKVPILTLQGQPVSGASNQVFYFGMSATRQGEVLASTLADSAKLERVILLQDERRVDGASLVESFQRALADARKSSKEPTAVLTVRYGKEANWSDLVERMQGYDAVVFAGSVQDFNAWHKVFRKEILTPEPRIIYAGNDGDQSLFDITDESKHGITLATAFFADPKSERMATFAAAYKNAFQRNPDVNSALGFDVTRILVDAMKRTAPQVTPDKVREELLNVKGFEGLTGPITIRPDRQAQRTLFAVRWQNGTTDLLKTFPGDSDAKEK